MPEHCKYRAYHDRERLAAGAVVNEERLELGGLVAGAGGALPLLPAHPALVAEPHLRAQRLLEVL